MGDTVYSRLPSELLDLSGILDIYFGNLLPAQNYGFSSTAIYSNTTEYSSGPGYGKKFTTSAIDVTNMSWLKGTDQLKDTGGGTTRAYLNLAGTGTETYNIRESRVFVFTNNDYITSLTPTSTSYVTFTFYLFVGDLTGSQQFDYYIKSSTSDGYSRNFYLYPQFIGVIT